MAGTKEPHMDLGSWNEPTCDPSMSYPSDGAEMGRMRTSSKARLAAISRTIEVEVIPRLVRSRRAAAPGHAIPDRSVMPTQTLQANAETVAAWLPGAMDVTELTRLALARDEGAAGRRIDELTERGVSLETICAELLGPAARRLGELWEDDRVNFTEVTTGVWRLQQILRAMAPAFSQDLNAQGTQRSILLVPAIGEQHSLGIAMVAAHFRKEGWSVRTELVSSNKDLAALVRSEWFDVIGFSVGSSDRLEELTLSISDTRSASRNVHLGVMVGGPVFLAHPEFVALVGADATAANGAEASANAEQLITSMAHTG